MRHIYCDGACQPNPGWMGVGVYIKTGARVEFAYSSSHGMGTNQQAELIALIKAIEKARDGDHIFTDSQYAIGILNGWKAKVNRELALQLRTVVKTKDVKISWVHGHNGNAGNDRADALANESAKPPEINAGEPGRRNPAPSLKSTPNREKDRAPL